MRTWTKIQRKYDYYEQEFVDHCNSFLASVTTRRQSNAHLVLF